MHLHLALRAQYTRMCFRVFTQIAAKTKLSIETSNSAEQARARSNLYTGRHGTQRRTYRLHGRTSQYPRRGALCAVTLRSYASGQYLLGPYGVALRAQPGRAHGPAHRGPRRSLSQSSVVRSFYRGPPLAWPGLGRRPLLSTRPHGLIRGGLGQARCIRAYLSLLLHEGRAPRGKRTACERWHSHLCRHVPKPLAGRGGATRSRTAASDTPARPQSRGRFRCRRIRRPCLRRAVRGACCRMRRFSHPPQRRHIRLSTCGRS